MHDLRDLQRWMQAVLMHPGGAEAGAASEAARQAIDVPPEQAERVVTRSRALSGLERLAIYNRAYYARLLECLRESYPVLFRALGEEAFDGFALDYLQKYPSRSYTLNDLGANFPRYLRESRPADEPGPGWPDFVIDLAALEWTYNEIFDGPGVEGRRLLRPDRLRAIPPERWPEARLVAVPCLRLMELRYPVHLYYTAVRRRKEPEFSEPAETFLAITRRRSSSKRVMVSMNMPGSGSNARGTPRRAAWSHSRRQPSVSRRISSSSGAASSGDPDQKLTASEPSAAATSIANSRNCNRRARPSADALMRVGWCLRHGSSRKRAPVSTTERSFSAIS